MEQDPQIDDRQRLTRLWLSAEPTVQAYVYASVRGVHDAEDVLQQVALTVARRFDEYDDSRPFIAWVLWLARSRVTDHYRKKGRERLVFSVALLERFELALVQGPREQSSRREALEHCLDKLPEKSRRLIELRYENEAPMQSVADALGSTAASVRVMLYRVRNVLAECAKAELARETA